MGTTIDRQTAFLAVIIIAATMNLIAFIIYGRDISHKGNRPSIITWIILTAMSILNVLSFKAMTEDLVLSLPAIVGSAMCFYTLVLTVIKGNFVRPVPLDYAVLSIAAISFLLWQVLGSAMYANFMAVLGVAAGYIPTYRSVLEDPKNEPRLPWYLWAVTFSFMVAAVVLKRKGAESFVYPVSIIILTLGVLIIRNYSYGRRINNNA